MSIVEYIRKEIENGYLDGFKAQALVYMADRVGPDHKNVAAKMLKRSSGIFENKKQRGKLYKILFNYGISVAELRELQNVREKYPTLSQLIIEEQLRE